ncbi:DUF1189 family protein [Haploplasma axanthum]|uniref:Predicted integral membrane protein n=1 Tax=Haploplasma axanthum TaxID=29552 RepID=A0A449BFB1_HAPAX|nr:DUF1189 family protein [Haploplasma axanthum]VEU81133.1 Predicted integral membrane protein [Haploplasma axanthum]
MFLIKYFKNSFEFPKLLKSLDKPFWKIIIYFIVLVLIANFPASYEAVKNDGSRLDFVIEDFSKEIPINWDLPNDIVIKGGKLINNGDQKVYKNKHKDITYIINNQEKITDITQYKNHIILSEESIIYVDGKGKFLEAIGYKGFSDDQFSFKELKISNQENQKILFEKFASSIEKSFSSYTVFYTIVRNNLTQILVNVIYVLILSGLVQLFRFGYQNFISFKDTIKFVVLSMGLASVLAFFSGLLSFPFGPVVFQLTTGMTVMLVMLIFGKKTFV